MWAEFREALFFPVAIFRIPDRLFDSVLVVESHDIEKLTEVPGRADHKNFDKIA